MNLLNGRARIAAIISGILLISGCGGGGGGGSTAAPITPATPAATATPSGPVGQAVTVPLHGMTPTAIVYQAGTSGAWTAVTPSGNNVTFTLPAGTTTYSVAAQCPFNGVPPFNLRNGPAEVILQATTADSPVMYCRPPSNQTGATINATAFVSMFPFPSTDNYSVTQLVPGSMSGAGFSGAGGVDAFGSPLWFAGTSDVAIQVRDTNGVPVAARLVRNVTFTPNQTITFNPMSTVNDAATTQNVTLPAGFNGGLGYWIPAEGGAVGVVSFFQSTAMPLIPGAGAGDYYFGFTSGNGPGYGFTGSTASTPAGLNLALATGPLNYTAATQIGDLCSMNLAYSGFTVTGSKFYSINLSYQTATQPVANGAPLLVVLASPSYLGTSTTVTIPDLSKVSGMLPNPTGGEAVGALGEAFAWSSAPIWDNMDTSNAFFIVPLAKNQQFQAIQASNYFNYNAP